jgi:hypothetical protein
VMEVGFPDRAVHWALVPRVTWRVRANSTTRSFTCSSVRGPLTLAQRSRVVSSGARSRYSRQNWRMTQLSPGVPPGPCSVSA